MNSDFEEALLNAGRNKDIEGKTWDTVAFELNEKFGLNLSGEKCRKRFRRLKKSVQTNQEDLEETIAEQFVSLGIERTKVSDIRTQANADIRRISREETLKEIAHEVSNKFDKNFRLIPKKKVNSNGREEAILQISDWHYGIEVDNFWNKYNPEIAKERISQLRDEVMDLLKGTNVTTINVVNLGDLISGRIHLPLRINTRIDTVTQTIEVSELLAQFLFELSGQYNIKYYSTTDNHSRVEPVKENSLDLESFSRFTDWFLKERLKSQPNIQIFDNEFSDDIVSFEVLGHKVIAVHGDKDKPKKIISNMTLMTHTHYDLVLSAHLHHFSADEQNETLLISNGTLMGTDDYAEKLRLSSYPSQNLIITTKNNVMHSLHRIVLK